MGSQSSDGHSLLLKYVSYVTKMRDHKLLKSLIFHNKFFTFIKHLTLEQFICFFPIHLFLVLCRYLLYFHSYNGS